MVKAKILFPYFIDKGFKTEQERDWKQDQEKNK